MHLYYVYKTKKKCYPLYLFVCLFWFIVFSSLVMECCGVFATYKLIFIDMWECQLHENMHWMKTLSVFFFVLVLFLSSPYNDETCVETWNYAIVQLNEKFHRLWIMALNVRLTYGFIETNRKTLSNKLVLNVHLIEFYWISLPYKCIAHIFRK